MIDEILGKVSAYAYAVEKGYTGTEAQFAYDLAHAADYASTAGTAAENASESEENAKDSEEAAALSERNAKTYSDNAHADAAAALDAKAQAITAKNDAVSAKGNAENFASIAEDAKESATQSEQNASQSAESASDDAEAASNSASSASANSLKSEGFAVGEQNGVPVEGGSPYYENNSKYYCEEAANQLILVTNEGTRQIGLVTDEGTAQKAAVQEKGEQTLASIPEDYTTLRNDVSSLKSDLNDDFYLLFKNTLTASSFVRGGINSTSGAESSFNSDSRIRSRGKIEFPDGGYVVSPYYVYMWDYVTNASITNGYVIGNNLPIPAGSIVKISLTKTPNANTPETTENILSGFMLYRYNDILINDPEEPLYFAPNGNDNNSGKYGSPKLTVQTAINEGHRNIVLAPGKYTGQTLNLTNKGDVSIVCYSETGQATIFDSQNRKAKAYFDNSVDVTLEAYNSIYRSALELSTDSLYYKVFVSNSLPLVYTGTYYGQDTPYNANLWEQTDSIITSRKMVPVLTLSECESTQGTFYYDGTYLYVNPYNGTINGKTYKRLYNDSQSLDGVKIERCNNVVLDGIGVQYFSGRNLYIVRSSDVSIKDCYFAFTAYNSGCQVHSSDATFENCISGGAGVDGFGIANYANVALYNCSGLKNADDGISHHQYCSGLIDGGEWAYNLSGGITPAFGAIVPVKNAICHDNAYGINLLSESALKTDNYYSVISCAMYNNSQADFGARYANANLLGCHYTTTSISNSNINDFDA